MTDSKTAKKVEVVPCHFGRKGHFDIEVDGLHYRDPLTHQICWGTEAEAQAKAAELRKDSSVELPSSTTDEQRVTNRDELHAKAPSSLSRCDTSAAQPTETRPPQEVTVTISEDEHFNNSSDSLRLWFLRKQLSRIEEALPARAAAPVEQATRPQEGTYFYTHCPRCGERLWDDYSHDCKISTAASSPVARPQPIVCPCCGGANGNCTGAARVEQPTNNTCACGHSIEDHEHSVYGDYCIIKDCNCANFNSTAPVVAQRELGQSVAQALTKVQDLLTFHLQTAKMQSNYVDAQLLRDIQDDIGEMISAELKLSQSKTEAI